MEPTTNDAASKGPTAGKASVRTKKAKKGNKVLKPKRPLSAYNFFFQYERDLMLRNMPSKFNLDHNQHHMTLHKPTSIRKSKNKSSRPPPHGKIRFAQLAKIIGPKWKTVDPQRRKHFEALAAADMKRYKSECQEYKVRINAEAQQQQQQYALPVKETSEKSAAGAMVGAAAGAATSSTPEHNSRVLPNKDPTRMTSTYNILTEACKIAAFPSVENNTPSMQYASPLNTVLLPQVPQLATSCQSAHHPALSQRADAALPKAMSSSSLLHVRVPPLFSKLRNPTTPANGTTLPTATCLSPLATVPTATCLSPLVTKSATVGDCLSPSSVETTSTNASSWLSPSSATESTNEDAAGHDSVDVTDTDMLNFLEVVVDAIDVPRIPTCTSRLTTPVPDGNPSANIQDSPAQQRHNSMSTYGMLDLAVNIANLAHQDVGVSSRHPGGLSSPSASSAKMPSVQHQHVQESSVDVSMDSFDQDIFADSFGALEDPEMQATFDL